MAELLHDQLSGVGVQRLGNRGHHAELHQRLDHVGRARGHAVGQLLDRDLLGQHDIAHDSHLIGTEAFKLGLAPLALALTANRGQAADALVLALYGRLDIDASRAAVLRSLLGRGDLRLAGRQRSAGTADRPRLLLFVGPTDPKPQCLGGRGGRGSRSGGWTAAGIFARPRGRCSARHRGLRRGSRHASRCRGGIGDLARFLLEKTLLRLGGLAARFLFGGLAGLLLAPARFLGGGQDGDLLLFAPLRLTAGVLALLFDQRPLARGEFGGG